ncbi:MAG TPA: radical SAM/SPASM domain-containing protein [Verrucomicrobiae bacterium]|nr:radical SAM/SPASM domain-containing protein [Verrucomicrobiae bacterium]
MSLKLGRYRVDEPGDALLTRLVKRLTRRSIPPFPRTVQVETIAACNASCVWCPYGKAPAPTGRMPGDRFERLVEECARHRVRRFSPYLTNEPFLDPQILDRVALAAKEIPLVRVVLTTNGSRLTPEVADRLLSLDGALHSLYVSFQGIAKRGYEDTMRGHLHFERVLANVNHLLAEMRRRKVARPKIWITMVGTQIVDAPRAVAYWKKRGVRAKYTALENRGGNIEGTESMSLGAMDYYTDCARLFKQAYISFDGTMVLCCTDYGRKHVLGNVFDDGIEAVWRGTVAEDLRRRYLTGKIHTIGLCSVCRVDREREVVG